MDMHRREEVYREAFAEEARMMDSEDYYVLISTQYFKEGVEDALGVPDLEGAEGDAEVEEALRQQAASDFLYRYGEVLDKPEKYDTEITDFEPAIQRLMRKWKQQQTG